MLNFLQQIINNFTMLSQIASEIVRPKSMSQNHRNGAYSYGINNFISNKSPDQNEQYINKNEKQYISNRTTNDRKLVYVVIPNNKTQSGSRISSQRKNNMYSRQNMQIINKRNREIRSTRFSQSIGIYDNKNNKLFVPARTSSALTQYVDHSAYQRQKDIQPIVKSVTKTNNLKNTTTLTISRNVVLKSEGNKQLQQEDQFLKSKNSLHPRKYDGVAKQTAKKAQKAKKLQKIEVNGYIANKFQSKLKKKCVEDNLNVMATLLKRKMKIMDKQDIVIYLKKFMTRNLTQK